MRGVLKAIPSASPQAEVPQVAGPWKASRRGAAVITVCHDNKAAGRSGTAKVGLERPATYSITSSARARSVGGIVRPRAKIGTINPPLHT